MHQEDWPVLRGSFAQNVHQYRKALREKGLWTFIREDVRNWLDRLAVQRRAGHYIRGFHRLYYHAADNNPPQTWKTSSWLGVPAQKCPLDLFVYQELLFATRPAVIVETGTAAGGSALYLASLCDLLGQGEVITVDIADASQVQHPRITRLIGSSTDPAVVAQVHERVAGRPAMVLLDSDHSRDHVLGELAAYSPLVPIGGYIVVEDSNIHGHPVGWQYGPGPTEAIREFLRTRDDFVVDRRCERHLVTFNPGGYLRRVRYFAHNPIL
jgi:cephalosporin hydroxylase